MLPVTPTLTTTLNHALTLTPLPQAESHRINWANISLALKCAVRVTVMNESDVDVLCPKVSCEVG